MVTAEIDFSLYSLTVRELGFAKLLGIPFIPITTGIPSFRFCSYQNSVPRCLHYLLFLPTTLAKWLEKFDKMNISTLPQLLLSCHRVVPRKLRRKAKKKIFVNNWVQNFFSQKILSVASLLDWKTSLIFGFSWRKKVFGSFSGFHRLTDCLHLWIFDDPIMRFCIRSIFQKYLIPLLQIFLCISQEKLVVFASDIFSSQLRHWIALKLLVQLNLNAIEHWTFNISHYKCVKNKWILFKRGKVLALKCSIVKHQFGESIFSLETAYIFHV